MVVIKKKCSKCNKKKVFIENCKCGEEFCLDCLPFYKHECTFDWKKEKQQNLISSNPKMEYIKVSDI